VDVLDGPRLRMLIDEAANQLEEQKDEVDALNVFPVPDGDTGTNMSLTLASAAREATRADGGSVHEVAQAAALGSLMGARGNSGVILSQLLRGFALGLSGIREARPADVSRALDRAVATAYQAVMKPVEGTILTVAREAARASKDASGGGLLDLFDAVRQAAADALERTPDMLPVLKRAGVVDAGGKGLVLIFERWVDVLDGRVASRRSSASPARVEAASPAPADLDRPYDVQLIVRDCSLAPSELRRRLAPLGDSLLVGGERSLAKVHIHAGDPAQVLALCMEVGEIDRVEIVDMRRQAEEFARRGRAGAAGEDRMETGARAEARAEAGIAGPAVVTVAMGDGLKKIFKSLGAAFVLDGGQTMNPSTEDLLQAVTRLSEPCALLLPNNANVVAAAEQAASLSAKPVRVVPTRSVPEGIAALLAFNPEEDLASNERKMTEASRRVATGLVTFAVRDANVKGMEVRAGSVLGLIGDDIEVVGEDREDVAVRLVERMARPSSEIVTLFHGADVDGDEAGRLGCLLDRRFPDLDIETYEGGQPYYYYIIAVE